MVEWSITVVLKTTVPRGTGGSNPSLSATYADFQHFKNRCVILCVTVQSSHIFFYIITCASNAAEIQAIVSIVTFIFPFSIRER